MTTNVLAALGPRNAALLANHGAIALGRNIQEAFTVCQLLEKTAKIYLLAFGLGKPNLVPADAADLEKAFFNAVYGEG
jgi:L-fuculose-phosphate aldolase